MAPVTHWVVSCPGCGSRKQGVPGAAVLSSGANGRECCSQFGCPRFENNVHQLIKMLRRSWESDRRADSQGTQWETGRPAGRASWMVMGPALRHCCRERSPDSAREHPARQAQPGSGFDIRVGGLLLGRGACPIHANYQWRAEVLIKPVQERVTSV